MKRGLTIEGAVNRRFILIAPPNARTHAGVRSAQIATSSRDAFIREAQRLRGRSYLDDGAITAAQLTRDGRHVQPIDASSWHLLTLDDKDAVVGCIRYLHHPATTQFDRLSIRSSALALSDDRREPFRRAVNQELSVARAHGLACIEVGGWAIDPSVRGGLDALRTVLFTFAWCIAAGGCVGLSVATLRNGSAAILQRVGGRPLECDGQALPPYFDARYGCEMVALRFDSQHLSPKYRHVVEAMHADMQKVPVVSAVSSSPPRREVRAQIALPAGVFRQAIAPLAALSTGLTDAAS